MYLLPPAVPVQPVRRPGAGHAPPRQSPQRQVLATGLVAGDRTLSGSTHPQVFPGRFGVCPAEAAAALGEGRLPLRHPSQGQRRAGAEDRPPPQAAGGAAVAQAEEVLCQLPVSGRVVGPGPPGGGEGGVARGGAVPPCRLPRDQPEVAFPASGAILQRARYSGAMDKRGEKCGEVDQAVMSPFQGQCGAVAVVRPGLQPGQLASATGTAQAHQELDADDAAGEVSQDRGQGGGRTPSTWFSNWRRQRCPANCSRPSWSGSAGCGWSVPRGEAGGDGQNGLPVVAVRSGYAVRVKF